MRLYLDTNIVLAYMGRGDCELSRDVAEMLGDYSNLLYTSATCAQEIVQLCQIGKLSLAYNGKAFNVVDFDKILKELDIEVVPVGLRHVKKLAELPFYQDHRDPNDRLIVSQAIVDQAVLVSSDTKMERYRKFGLNFVFNKR